MHLFLTFSKTDLDSSKLTLFLLLKSAFTTCLPISLGVLAATWPLSNLPIAVAAIKQAATALSFSWVHIGQLLYRSFSRSGTDNTVVPYFAAFTSLSDGEPSLLPFCMTR